MPAKKQQRNAFYFFMQELIPVLRNEGRVLAGGMAEIVPIAHPRYKALPEKEKQRFEDMAKEYKKRMKGAEGDKRRYDNVGNIIANRKDPRAEAEKRRQREMRDNTAPWVNGFDVRDQKFYLIDFQILCKTEEDYWLPCEVGALEFSMSEGITKTLHIFIEPGAIPTGYRFECMSNSEATHKIPVQGFEKADRNYSLIWTRLCNFVNPDGRLEESPPFYTLISETKKVHTCLQWVHDRAMTGGRPNRLKKVYELEGLFHDLLKHGGQEVSLTGSTDQLTTHQFDAEANTRCAYHEEMESNHCALGDCKKRVYAMMDTLANKFDFHLTENHLPVRDDSVAYTVIKPEQNSMKAWTNQPKNFNSFSPTKGYGGTDFRYQNQAKEEPPRFEAEPALRRPAAPAMASQILYQRQPTPLLRQPTPAQLPRAPAPRAPVTSTPAPPLRPTLPPQTSGEIPPWSIGSTAQLQAQQQQEQVLPPWTSSQLNVRMAGVGRGMPPQAPPPQAPPPATVAPQPTAAWQQSAPLRAPPGLAAPVWRQPAMRGITPALAMPPATNQAAPQMSPFQQQFSAISLGAGRGRGRGVYNPLAATGAVGVRMPPGFGS